MVTQPQHPLNTQRHGEQRPEEGRGRESGTAPSPSRPLPRRPLPPPPPLSGAHSVPWWGAPEDAWKGRSADSTCGFPVR